jgi:HSP90 family molecular chaperone
MAEYKFVVRVVIVTGAWRLSMHRPAWLRPRVRVRGWVRVFDVRLSVSTEYLTVSKIMKNIR